MPLLLQVADKAEGLRKGGAAAHEAGPKADAAMAALNQAVEDWEHAGAALTG